MVVGLLAIGFNPLLASAISGLKLPPIKVADAIPSPAIPVPLRNPRRLRALFASVVISAKSMEAFSCKLGLDGLPLPAPPTLPKTIFAFCSVYGRELILDCREKRLSIGRLPQPLYPV